MEPSGFGSGQRRSRLLARGPLGVGLAVVGAVMMFLGWYGVSGRPNLAEQMPYLASGTIPGAALIVAAAVVLMSDSEQRTSEQTRAMMSDLHSLFVEDVPGADPTTADAPDVDPPTLETDNLVMVGGGEHYHRADCSLVAGKPDASRVDRAGVDRNHLQPCPICEPEKPPEARRAD